MKLYWRRTLVVTLSALLALTAQVGRSQVSDDRSVSSGRPRNLNEGVGQSTLGVQSEPTVDTQPEVPQNPKELPKDQQEQPKVWLTTSKKDGQSFVTAHWQGLGEPALLVFKKIYPKPAEVEGMKVPQAELPRPDWGDFVHPLGSPVVAFSANGAGERAVRMLPGPLIQCDGTVVTQIGVVITKSITVNVKDRLRNVDGRPKRIFPKTLEEVSFAGNDFGPELATIACLVGPNAVKFLDVEKTREFQVPEGGHIAIFTDRRDVLAESHPIELPKP